MVGANEYFSSLIHKVLPTEIFAVQINRIVSAEWIKQDVNVVFETEFIDARSGSSRSRFNSYSPQTD